MADASVEEVWKAVAEFPGRYEVSSLGRVRSLKGGTVRVLKPAVASDGYRGVIIVKDGRYCRRSVGRLIAIAFLGLQPGQCVDHINGIKTDDKLCNLRVASISQNSWNCGKRPHNTSGYKGVTKIRRGAGEMWVAQIACLGKRRTIGRFDSPEKAFAAYCAEASRLHGSFARFV